MRKNLVLDNTRELDGVSDIKLFTLYTLSYSSILYLLRPSTIFHYDT